MPYFHQRSGKSLHPIGGIGGLEHLEQSEYDLFLKMGMLYIHGILGIPPQYTELNIRTIEDNHHFERMIVLEFDNEPDGAEIYALKAEAVLHVFVSSVNWQSIEKKAVDDFVLNQDLYITTEMIDWAEEECQKDSGN